MDKNIIQMTRAEYTAAKNNRTLICPNVCKITDENNHTEKLMANPIVDIGIAALVNGVTTYYSREEWEALEVKPTDIGTYVTTSDGILVLHPTILTNQRWSNNTSVYVPGCFANGSAALAKLDLAGYENTEAVLAAVQAGTIEDAPAFTAARALTFANGATPFIPAAGQWDVIYNNMTEINACRAALGQTLITFGAFWSSSQGRVNDAWYYFASGINNYSNKNVANSVVVVAKL